MKDKFFMNVIDWRGQPAMTEVAGVYTGQQMKQMEREFQFGPPRKTAYYTTEELAARGFVGLYERAVEGEN